MSPHQVHVVGTGLIGTSLALALASRGVDVTLEDVDAESARIAAERGAGRLSDSMESADIVVLAVPPTLVAGELQRREMLNLKATFMDVASVKSVVMAEVETLGCDIRRFVPTHPIAGRERGGPMNARADLFHGRSWVLTPALADEWRVGQVVEIIELCGARGVRLSVGEHDAALALVSHLPQLAASALAAQLADAPFDVALLAGQGLRDSTRIAESDPALWADIAGANAQEIAPLVEQLRDEFVDLARGLRSVDPRGAVRALVARGQLGRSRVGATHGRPTQPVDVVSVLLRDTPGELARIFIALRDAEVNVDDIRIDHAPGAAVGVLELVVTHEAGALAVAALGEWQARVASSLAR